MRIHPFEKVKMKSVSKMEAAKTALKCIFFLYLGLFLLSKINLVIVDLGRHIMNGKVFVEQGIVVGTNFYSYTHPDFPVVTHHWGTGVLYYFIHKLFGFVGLSVFNSLVAAFTMYFLYRAVRGRVPFSAFALAALLFVPLLASRKEVRPENLSYLFVAVYIFLFESYKEGRLSGKSLYIVLFILQVVWVNTHIFFVFGIMISVIYCVYIFVFKKPGDRNWKLITPAFLVVLASLINPFGLEGFLTPFNIFRNYGYMISENQSVFFMQKRYPSFEYFFVELAAVWYVFFGVSAVAKRRALSDLPMMVVCGIFLLFAFRYIRAFPLFAVSAVPLVSLAVKSVRKFTVSASVIVILLGLVPGTFFSPFQKGLGVGLSRDSLGSGNFYKVAKLSGPIFNNYDIGSYLIYSLYPDEKVFVDNRPEAYPSEFFTDVYVPMQEYEEKWKEVKDLYGFNVIFFFRRDMTPWAQPFLISRLADPEWVPIYVDDFALILVKNNDQNRGLIEKYRLPPEIFVVTKQ